MAFTHTFDSLSKVLSNDSPVELTISNNSITIDPNTGNYFFLDGIDTNLTINLSNLTEGYTKTIYLRLNFDEDDIVLSWPTNIKWQEISSPAISVYEDLFILLMTLDGGTTWYSEPVIKTNPIVDLSLYMQTKYPSTWTALTSVPIANLNYFSKIRANSCESMFSNCSSLTSLDLSTLDTSNVTTMANMFQSCSSLTSLDVSNWDTSNVANINSMFYGCSSLTSLDLSNWDTSNVTDMTYMFQDCSSLASLDLSNWDTSNVTSMSRIFFGCSSLGYLIIGSPAFKFQMKDYNCGQLNTTCKILVPQSVLSTYTNATNWSSKASQFDAIENYTITRSNGLVTVMPNS